MHEAELQKATGDIYYEAHMLYTAYTNYWERESSGLPGQPRWLHNCIIEATLVHTRALLDVFERTRTPRSKNSPREDDVLAEDYDFPPKAFPLSPELRKRINTSIAHLSYGRTQITDHERHWDFTVFIPPILLRSSAFFQHLLDSGKPRSSFPGDPAIKQFIANAKSKNAT